MKVCPLCAKIYQDEMNYCLEDGQVLRQFSAAESSEKTLPYSPSAAQTDENKRTNVLSGGAANNSRRIEAQTVNLPAPKSKFWTIAAVLAVIFVTLMGALIYGGLAFYRSVKSQIDNQNNAGNVNRGGLIIPGQRFPEASPTTVKYGKMSVEVGERVKDNFGQKFIRCLATNTGENVIKNPSVKLTLYKNDLKIGDAYGKSELVYLKPAQTIPIWVGLSEDSNKYTSARVDESVKQELAKYDAATLFPSLAYTDTKLTNELKTSLLNFRPYKEMYYIVAGTVENRQYDKLDVTIYVVFRNKDGEIVGVHSTHPPELKKNEKAEFTASMGGMGLFGTPTDYELIAVDDH